MTWDTRPDGQPDLSVLVGYALVAIDEDAIGLRLEYAETQAQLLGSAKPSVRQIALPLAVAMELAQDIGDAVLACRKPGGMA